MIMGDICTRRCPFCDVGHGRPNMLDPDEPKHLAESVKAMNLRYVVITSVDRDDLRDGGAQHFAGLYQSYPRNQPEYQNRNPRSRLPRPLGHRIEKSWQKRRPT